MFSYFLASKCLLIWRPIFFLFWIPMFFLFWHAEIQVSRNILWLRPSSQYYISGPLLSRALNARYYGEAGVPWRAQIAIHLIIPYVFLMIWNSSPESPEYPESPDLPNLPEVVSGAAARDLPSTRAGGQDDVSSKQTPSNKAQRGYANP